MKTSFRILAACLAASLALVSCDKESLTKTETNETADGLRTITLSFANNGTKTALGDNNTPYFVGDETIKIAKSDGTATPVDLTVTVTDNVATITTDLEGELTAVYPSTAAKVIGNKITGVQVSTNQDGTFPSANICMATISDGKNPNAVFQNMTAVFKITPKAGDNTKYVEVITAGPEIADVTGGSKPYDSKHKIHVETTSADPVYVSILVPSGLKIRDLSFADGTNMKVNKSDYAVGAGTLYTVSSEDWDYDYVEVNGLKWATMNVGATDSNPNGLYFAWGETAGHVENTSTKKFENNYSFSWSNAPFNGKNLSYHADTFNEFKGTVCPNGVLALAYDAANVNWGGSWRMPTKEEFDAFLNGTDSYTPGEEDGSFTHQGVTFPAAGFGAGTGIGDAGDFGYYWSSSLKAADPSYAYFLYFENENFYVYTTNYNRFYGFAVRPLSE